MIKRGMPKRPAPAGRALHAIFTSYRSFLDILVRVLLVPPDLPRVFPESRRGAFVKRVSALPSDLPSRAGLRDCRALWRRRLKVVTTDSIRRNIEEARVPHAPGLRVGGLYPTVTINLVGGY